MKRCDSGLASELCAAARGRSEEGHVGGVLQYSCRKERKERG